MNDLLEKVESLKNLLVAHCTGGSGDDQGYKSLRKELIANPSVAADLPGFVRTCRNLSEFWGFIKPKFGTYSERREFLKNEFSSVLNKLEFSAKAPPDSNFSDLLEKFDTENVNHIWQKALDRRTVDPEGAITLARSLLESVCKQILERMEIGYDSSAELPPLYKLVAKTLNLAPDQHTEQIFKQILGGCQTVVEGLGALRNKLSDAHGPGSKRIKPEVRHALLAVNLAGTMAVFLCQTWEKKAGSLKSG